MNYFSNSHTVEAIKSEYRRLAMLHHPDRGGDTATMQIINAQYKEALKACHGQTTKGTDGQMHTYRYDEATEAAVMDALSKILRIKMNADVALIGLWVWVIGDTKPVKEQLKELGCMWHAKRSAWYWRPNEQRGHHYNRNVDLGGLAAAYGCKMFRTNDSETALA